WLVDYLLVCLVRGVLALVARLLEFLLHPVAPAGVRGCVDLEEGWTGCCAIPERDSHARLDSPLLVEGKHFEAEQADGVESGAIADGVCCALVDPEERVLESCSEKFILACEVVLQPAVGEPRLCSDLAHGGGGEASPGNDPPGRLDDLDAALIVIDNPGHLLPSSVDSARNPYYLQE